MIIGIIGESIADHQLHGFRSTQQGKVCDIGIWFYSRHPNYFFEFLVWLGFALFGLHDSQHIAAWLSFISPLWLLIIFTKITIPMTERGSIESKGQLYLDYQQRTAMFFPWLRSHPMLDKDGKASSKATQNHAPNKINDGDLERPISKN